MHCFLHLGLLVLLAAGQNTDAQDSTTAVTSTDNAVTTTGATDPIAPTSVTTVETSAESVTGSTASPTVVEDPDDKTGTVTTQKAPDVETTGTSHAKNDQVDTTATVISAATTKKDDVTPATKVEDNTVTVTIKPEDAVVTTEVSKSAEVTTEKSDAQTDDTKSTAKVTEVTKVVTDEPVTSTAETESPVVEDKSTKAETDSPDVQTTKEAAKEVTTAAAPQVTLDPNDPCNLATEDEPQGRDRYYAAGDSNGCDNNTKEGWYKFMINGAPAEIPDQCIKMSYCGTYMGFILDLEGQDKPALGETITARLCGNHMIMRKNQCCYKTMPVKVRRCPGDIFVYHLGGYNECPSGICLKKPNEVIPDKYLVNPPTEAPVTTEAPLDIYALEQDSLSSEEKSRVITVEFETKDNWDKAKIEDFDEKFRALIAKALNKRLPKATTKTSGAAVTDAADQTTAASAAAGAAAATTATATKDADATEDTKTADNVDTITQEVKRNIPAPTKQAEGAKIEDIDQDATGNGPPQTRRRRQTVAEVYEPEDIVYVKPTPKQDNGKMQMSVLVHAAGKPTVEQSELYDAVKAVNDSGEMQTETGHSASAIYKGLPKELDEEAALQATEPRSVWNTHKGLFITIIVLAIICLILLLVGFLCLKCRGKSSDKQSLHLEDGNRGVESPICDEEIVRPENTAVQHAAPNGRHDNEDNGWVVPIDQVQDKRDVEDTKL